jgi:hypothetical protein
VTTRELITDLRRRDIRLSVRGDRLRVDAPAGGLTPDVREILTRHKIDLLQLLQPPVNEFCFVDGLMAFGDVCHGWLPAGWAAELRRKADRCEQYRPDVAAYYRAWAADIERRLPSAAEKGGTSDAD